MLVSKKSKSESETSEEESLIGEFSTQGSSSIEKRRTQDDINKITRTLELNESPNLLRISDNLIANCSLSLDSSESQLIKLDYTKKECQKESEPSKLQEIFTNLIIDCSLLPDCSESHLLYLKIHIYLTLEKSLVLPNNEKAKSEALKGDLNQQVESLEMRLKVEGLDSSDIRQSLSQIRLDMETHDFKAMLNEVDRLLRKIRPLDIPELLRLITKGDKAIRKVKGKDTIAFLGGSGKFSAVHFLPESYIKETQTLTTNSSTGSEIEYSGSMNPVPITVGDKVVFLWDTVFGEKTGPEMNLSALINTVEAMKGCKSVKLIIVLNYNNKKEPFPGLKHMASILDGIIPKIEDHKNELWCIFNDFPKEAKGAAFDLLHQTRTKFSSEEKSNPSLKNLFQIMVSKVKNGAFTFGPDNLDNANKIRKELLKNIAASNTAIQNPENIFRCSISEKSKDAINRQLEFHQRDIISSLKRLEYCLVRKKLDDIVQLSEFLKHGNINQIYKECINYLKDHFNEKYNLTVDYLNSYLAGDSSFKLEDIKKCQKSFTEIKEAQTLLKSHMTEVIDVNVFEQNAISQFNDMISKLPQDINDTKWKTALDKTQLFSEHFSDIVHCYNKVCHLFRKKLDILIEKCNLSELYDFDQIADSLTRLYNTQTHLEHHHLVSYTEQKYTHFKKTVSDSIQNSVKQLYLVLQLQKLQNKEVIDLKKGLSILKSALNVQLLHLHIPKLEIQSLYDRAVGEILKYFERLDSKVKISQGKKEKSFEDLEELIDEMILIREIPVIKYQTAEVYYSTLEIVCRTINEIKKEIHQMLKSIFHSKEIFNFKNLENLFKRLQSAKWIDKHRSGFYSEGVSILEQEMLESINLFSSSIKEGSHKFDCPESLENGYTIISRINQLEPLKRSYSSIKIEVDDINLRFNNSLKKSFATIRNEMKRWNEYTHYRKEERDLLEEWKQPEFQDEQFKIAKEKFKQKWLVKPDPDSSKMEESLKYLNQCQKFKLLMNEDESLLTDLQKCIENYRDFTKKDMKQCLEAIRHPNLTRKEYVIKNIKIMLNELESISRIQGQFPQVNQILAPRKNLGEKWKKKLVAYSVELADEMHQKKVLQQSQELSTRLGIARELTQLDIFLAGAHFTQVYRSFLDITSTGAPSSLGKFINEIENHSYISALNCLRQIESLIEPACQSQFQTMKDILNKHISQLLEETQFAARAVSQSNKTLERIQTFAINLKNIQNAEPIVAKYGDNYQKFFECVTWTKQILSKILRDSSRSVESMITSNNFSGSTNQISFDYVCDVLGIYCEKELLNEIQANLVEVFKNELERLKQKKLYECIQHIKNFEVNLIYLPSLLRDSFSMNLKFCKEEKLQTHKIEKLVAKINSVFLRENTKEAISIFKKLCDDINPFDNIAAESFSKVTKQFLDFFGELCISLSDKFTMIKHEDITEENIREAKNQITSLTEFANFQNEIRGNTNFTYMNQDGVIRKMEIMNDAIYGYFDKFQDAYFEALLRIDVHRLKNILKFIKKWEPALTKITLYSEKCYIDKLSKLSKFLNGLKDYSAIIQDLSEKVGLLKKEIIEVDIFSLSDSKFNQTRDKIYQEINEKFNCLLNIRDLGDTNLFLSADRASQECNEYLQIKIKDLVADTILSLERGLSCTSTCESPLSEYDKFNAYFSNIESFRKNMKALQISKALTWDVVDQKVRNSVFKLKKEAQLIMPLGKVADYLIKMKNISEGLYRSKEFTNQQIDDLLMFYKTQEGGIRTIAKLGAILDNGKGEVGKALVSAHKCFQGYAIALFNTRTQRHGIDYVLQNLKGDLIENDLLQRLYDEFNGEYKSLVNKYLIPGLQQFDELISSIKSFVQKNEKPVIKYDKIPKLTAQIFALWTLQNSSVFFEAEGLDDRNNYLLQPHAAQVIAIFRMLCFRKKQPTLQNNLVQIGTGEGKSIVLAVTASVLAIMGFKVSCVCYSDYLSNRDHKSFKPLFKALDLDSFIRYGTFNKICEDLINENADIREAVKEIILNDKKQDSRKKCPDSRPKILLIDEVDVFFDFYGKTYRPLAQIYDPSISLLMDWIWNNRENLSYGQIKEKDEFKNCLKLFKNWEILFEQSIQYMLDDLKNYQSHEYIVHDDKICYKEHDNIFNNVSHRYKTLFAYFFECKQKNRISQKSLEENKCININCGIFSYAEIPSKFAYIIGVTGTLALNAFEKNIITTVYKVQQDSYIPSVYGANQLTFSVANDVKIEKEHDFFNALVDEIKMKIQGNTGKRAVLIFFESKLELMEFYESNAFNFFRDTTKIILEETPILDKEALINQATTSGQITLLTRIFGRGTDFVCHDDIVVANKGVHVIQAFFSQELSEEKQIKGRTARQGDYGSYSMIIKDLSLNKFSITKQDLEKVNRGISAYDLLDQTREQFITNSSAKTSKSVQKAQASHKEAEKFLACLRDEKSPNIKPFLFKMNGV